MMSWTPLSTSSLTTIALIALPIGVFGYFFSGLASLFYNQARSPLRHLRGPPSRSVFLGNLPEIHEQENEGLIQRWEDMYGSAFVYRGFIGGRRLMTTDPRAIAHILGHAYDYPKPDFIRDSLATMAAGYDGLIVAEGEQHRRLRKILNPAFATSHIKSLAPIFWDKAVILRDIWTSASPSLPSSTTTVPNVSSPSEPQYATSPTPSQPIDVLSWLTRATMDAMGIAGFGYHFNSLTSTSSDPHAPEDELAAAFATIFSSARKLRLITVFQAWFPILRRLRPDRHVMEHAQRVMGRIGSSLIAERTAYVLSEAKGSVTDAKSFLGRDLLSLMIKSSLSEEPSKQLSPSEALCQISTFLVAGHETTSNALSWALYALAKEPRIQQKLRDELRSLPISCVPGEEVSPEDVEAISRLPYLDSVIREVLRLHSPVTSTMRVCTREVDSVPMSIPFTDKHGTTRDTIELKKGDIISVPIQAINKSVKMWGPDAEEFLPERWLVENPAPEASAIPGVWSHILTFGNGNTLNGNRSCIGWRFALLEMKIFLYVLARDLDFRVEDGLVIDKRVNVVTRPVVRGREKLGNQMPLLLSRVPELEPQSPAS